MTVPRSKQLFNLSLAVLLLVPALPASAGGPAGGIVLGLEQAFALEGASFELGEGGGDELAAGAGGAPAAETGPDRGDLTRLGDASRMHEVAAERRLGDQARGKRGFGRWLKKYWYIPVLAAAAIVAVADDGSDDPNDPED